MYRQAVLARGKIDLKITLSEMSVSSEPLNCCIHGTFSIEKNVEEYCSKCFNCSA